MTTTTTAAEKLSEAQTPGRYFGTDGAGFDHYYQTGSRRMTVTDGTETRTFKIPREKDLVDWAIATVEEHEAYWEEVRVDPPKCHWLTGAAPVGEFREVRE